MPIYILEPKYQYIMIINDIDPLQGHQKSVGQLGSGQVMLSPPGSARAIYVYNGVISGSRANLI